MKNFFINEHLPALCSALAAKGIKPSLLIGGNKLMQELYAAYQHNKKSSLWLNKITINGFVLDIIQVDQDSYCEVYGNENC